MTNRVRVYVCELGAFILPLAEVFVRFTATGIVCRQREPRQGRRRPGGGCVLAGL